jgi:hypothetical protein
MNEPERLSELTALMVQKLAELRAVAELNLKVTAQLLAALTHQDAAGLLAGLKKEVEELSRKTGEDVLRDLAALKRRVDGREPPK